ncbi:uncharacterized protein B0H18DRAFT_869617 [Fomitopsis serialis]|uniref:uncharacterized protein n=1 Tax=Fomitopsis serialis TaxID=139415 RepID=UPI002007DBC4|nr:uncharacterized protein B0H18DRAFT_869617 [Neoantrodia serialis]KAH9934850.1 hypothetical protein B0H18DRAFT_869617 [Neoantrodia serialis]
MPLYLCVDCGGSKAAAVIADETGNPVARALGGPSNFAYLGLEPFVAVVKETVEKALKACIDLAGPLTLPPPAGQSYLAAAWFGVSGCDSPQAIADMTPALEALLGVRPRVANDTHLLAAPMTLYPDVTGAVAIVAGTGGIVVSFREAVHKETGEKAGLDELGRCGGWGWILGDEGGGFHVGREAIRQVLDEADRASVKPKTAEVSKPWGLRQRILARFGISDVYELLTIVHKPDPAPISPTTSAPGDLVPMSAMSREKRLSSLSPLVFAAAFADGDPLALSVLRATSSALVDQICVLLRAEGQEAGEGERRIRAAESILCMGGSLSGVEAYRKLIVDELARRGHVFRRVQVVDDAAAVGAKALTVMKT